MASPIKVVSKPSNLDNLLIFHPILIKFASRCTVNPNSASQMRPLSNCSFSFKGYATVHTDMDFFSVCIWHRHYFQMFLQTLLTDLNKAQFWYDKNRPNVPERS